MSANPFTPGDMRIIDEVHAHVVNLYGAGAATEVAIKESIRSVTVCGLHDDVKKKFFHSSIRGMDVDLCKRFLDMIETHANKSVDRDYNLNFHKASYNLQATMDVIADVRKRIG
jgi:hypothetical protein